MPLFRSGDRIALFVHIPKTGGSSLGTVLLQCRAKQALKTTQHVAYASCTPQHMHWEVLSRWLPADFWDYSFAVVRNPFARLASEYRWRERLAGRPLQGFDDWVSEGLRRYHEDPYVLDNHIRPQDEFVGPETEVFRFEEGLGAPIEAALRALGLEAAAIPVQHVNRSARAALPVTVETLGQIAGFYERDFRRFGYDPADVPEGLFDLRFSQASAQGASALREPSGSRSWSLGKLF